MEFRETALKDVVIVEPRVFGDSRGFFLECWRTDAFKAAGIGATFVQENQSRSVQGTLRGLHFQEPRPQGKLVRVMRGKIFDVAVDVRVGSPTFRRWVGVELSDENHLQLWVPAGFAHGFITLSDEVDMAYLVTEFYAPEAEQVIAWNDPAIGIAWPLQSPILSARDKQARPLSEARTLPAWAAR